MSGKDEKPVKKKVEWDSDYVARRLIQREFQYGVDTDSMIVRQVGEAVRRIIDDIPVYCRRCGAVLVLGRQDYDRDSNIIGLTHNCPLCENVIRTTIEGV